MGTLCAGDVMERTVICVSPDMTLKDAWDVFSNQRISGAPVVSESEGLVGVLSQTDILHYVTLQEESHRPQESYYIGEPYWDSDFFSSAIERLAEVCVDDVMSSTVLSVRPSDSVSTVAVMMRSNHVHRVIVTEDKRVVGIISALGLLRVLEQH